MEFLPKKIDQIMAEADELIRQIYSEKTNGLGEQQRAAFAEKVKRLKELKAMVKEKSAAQGSSVSSGIHEAIDELVHAINDTAKQLV